MADTTADLPVDTTPVLGGAEGRAYTRKLLTGALHVLVGLWIFSGGIILFEPSFYELLFVPVLLLALTAGMSLFSSTAPLLLVAIPFSAFGLIAAFQVRYTSLMDALIFVGVTIFLLITSYFVANFIAEAPERRMAVIRRAYIAIAVISSILGTLAYLGVLPGADIFVLYGRARGMFKDPNVYGPFLVLPAMFVLRDMFFGRGIILSGTIFLILLVGVFASFSRAAWAHFAFSAMTVYGLCFWLEAHARQKIRMMVLALAGGLIILVTFAGLLSIPSVSSLFEQRASATQDYDTGETGRFGRQGYAFELAFAHPWGMGPTEFGSLRIMEQPHNSYVTVLQAYGWGGGICYYILILATLWRGLWGLRNKAMRGYLIPVMSVYVPLVVQSGLIDTDHWRHYFLVIGLVWGLTARADPQRRSADLGGPRLPSLPPETVRG